MYDIHGVRQLDLCACADVIKSNNFIPSTLSPDTLIRVKSVFQHLYNYSVQHNIVEDCFGGLPSPASCRCPWLEMALSVYSHVLH